MAEKQGTLHYYMVSSGVVAKIMSESGNDYVAIVNKLFLHDEVKSKYAGLQSVVVNKNTKTITINSIRTIQYTIETSKDPRLIASELFYHITNRINNTQNNEQINITDDYVWPQKDELTGDIQNAIEKYRASIGDPKIELTNTSGNRQAQAYATPSVPSTTQAPAQGQVPPTGQAPTQVTGQAQNIQISTNNDDEQGTVFSNYESSESEQAQVPAQAQAQVPALAQTLAPKVTGQAPNAQSPTTLNANGIVASNTQGSAQTTTQPTTSLPPAPAGFFVSPINPTPQVHPPTANGSTNQPNSMQLHQSAQNVQPSSQQSQQRTTSQITGTSTQGMPASSKQHPMTLTGQSTNTFQPQNQSQQQKNSSVSQSQQVQPTQTNGAMQTHNNIMQPSSINHQVPADQQPSMNLMTPQSQQQLSSATTGISAGQQLQPNSTQAPVLPKMQQASNGSMQALSSQSPNGQKLQQSNTHGQSIPPLTQQSDVHAQSGQQVSSSTIPPPSGVVQHNSRNP